MGTDTTERTIPCPCGTGEILIETSTPDHPWVSAYNVSHSIQILRPPCAERYMVDDTRIVDRAEYIAYKNAEWKLDEARERIGKSSAIRDVQAAFGSHLDTFRSVAAVFRYLEQNGLAGMSIGTFCKSWSGGPHWADRHVSSWNIVKVLGLLGRPTDQFDEDLKQIEVLAQARPRVKTVKLCF